VWLNDEEAPEYEKVDGKGLTVDFKNYVNEKRQAQCHRYLSGYESIK
jgi:hypothetical protein